MAWLLDSSPSILPWFLVAVFGFIALGLDRRVAATPRGSRVLMRAKLAVFSRPRWQSSLALGALTPLIPCGLLYLLWLACLMSGSPWYGAEIALGFGVGTVPGLLLAQGGFVAAERRLSPQTIRAVQRSLATVALVVLLWRLRGAFGFETGDGWLCL